MTRSLVVSALVFGLAAACSSATPSGEPTAASTEPIQGGSNDTTDVFAVSVVQTSNQGVGLCSGALLERNLVVTARHCVVDATALSGQPINCASTTFPPVVNTGQLQVTQAASFSTQTLQAPFVPVTKIIVPGGANQNLLCGNDIALLVLGQNLPVPGNEYVTPAINPPLTDHHTWATSVAAIGYGISTPTDTNGATAGTRRIKQNINLLCIPNDTTYVDCFSDPQAKSVMSVNEFQSGDGTCEGDSGSSAYDQTQFANKKWFSFGVLSRGGVQGSTCTGAVYTRLDSWASLIIDAANQAAQAGGYAPPAWATGSSSADGGSSSSSGGGDGGASTGKSDGSSCKADGECASQNCVSIGNGPLVCASACGAKGSCASGTTCKGGDDAGVGGFCFPNASSTTTTKSGCAVSVVDSPSDPIPWRTGVLVAGLAGFAVVRRRRRPNRRSGRSRS